MFIQLTISLLIVFFFVVLLILKEVIIFGFRWSFYLILTIFILRITEKTFIFNIIYNTLRSFFFLTGWSLQIAATSILRLTISNTRVLISQVLWHHFFRTIIFLLSIRWRIPKIILLHFDLGLLSLVISLLLSLRLVYRFTYPFVIHLNFQIK